VEVSVMFSGAGFLGYYDDHDFDNSLCVFGIVVHDAFQKCFLFENVSK
jgi:hypothetical protein